MVSVPGSSGDSGLHQKPQPPPHASSGGTSDRNANRDLPDEKPKVKTEGTSSTTAPPTQKTPKNKNSYASRKKLKAPADSDPDSLGEIAATWFMAKNPMMRIIQPQISGSLKGPVTPPPETTNKLEAMKAILFPLKETGVTPGPFAAKDLFDLELETIQNTQLELSRG
ncbi:hypothetical protein PInf_026917 [Phytophthora infestans]|nr:hypothetical protein PInf_026917 [Phytophthora infestans]